MMDPSLRSAMVESLHHEALDLAQSVRDWFTSAASPRTDGVPHVFDGWAGQSDRELGVLLSCESLRLTSRLMHVIAWTMEQMSEPHDSVPEAVATADEDTLQRLPGPVRTMVSASLRLHERAVQIACPQAEVAAGAPALQSLLAARLNDLHAN